MDVVEVSGISKTFGQTKAVDDVYFEARAGEMLGMVGPNGAGKTTTMRILMDIIRPDSGEVRVLGQLPADATKNRIGYLPEERGLYRKLTVTETITYLSTLKMADPRAVAARSEDLLTRLGMFPHRHKKIEALSRGMGQIIQFIVTVAHNPDLIVMDEPFSGLDPVNTRLIKSELLLLRERGKTIILSTHLMNDVEELCDRVLMIDKGRVVLYGGLTEVKQKYRDNSILVQASALPKELPGVTSRRQQGGCWELSLAPDTDPNVVLRYLLDNGSRVERFELATPSLNDIFIRVVEAGR